MNVVVWALVAGVSVALLLVLVSKGVNSGVDPTQLLLDPELIGRVRVLAQANQQLAAIKLLREGTPGLGIGSAKVMVNKMAMKQPPDSTG